MDATTRISIDIDLPLDANGIPIAEHVHAAVGAAIFTALDMVRDASPALSRTELGNITSESAQAVLDLLRADPRPWKLAEIAAALNVPTDTVRPPLRRFVDESHRVRRVHRGWYQAIPVPHDPVAFPRVDTPASDDCAAVVSRPESGVSA